MLARQAVQLPSTNKTAHPWRWAPSTWPPASGGKLLECHGWNLCVQTGCSEQRGFPPDIHPSLVLANRTLSFLQVASPLGGDLISKSVESPESPNADLLLPWPFLLMVWEKSGLFALDCATQLSSSKATLSLGHVLWERIRFLSI